MRKNIGNYLQDLGLLNEKKIIEIRKHSESTGKKFGDSAVELGFITKEDLRQVFGPNFEFDFFHLNKFHYPTDTRELLSLEEIIRHGALPLGTKVKVGRSNEFQELNIGLIDPSVDEDVQQMKIIAKRELGDDFFNEVHIYLILPNQFLEVLEHHYKLSKDDLLAMGRNKVGATLWEYLQSLG